MADEMTIVTDGLSAQQAESLKRMLAERDVEAYVAPSESARGEWSLLTESKESARAIRFVEVHLDADEIDPENVIDDRQWSQWPTCPACDWRRITRCRFCGAIGNEFPVADGAPVTEFAPILLMCDTCDEPFEPEFLNHCNRCQEPFDDGVDFAYQTTPGDAGNPRVVMAIGAMALIGLMLFAYWWWLIAPAD